jgi:hypothetical protein
MAAMLRRAVAVAVALVPALAPRVAAAGASQILRFEAAYTANQPWYEGKNNETGTLAWGEGYVLASLVEAYLATDDPRWLVELVDHADAALAERDSVRGVTDYRGKSLPCWRATKYSTKPYCWAVHTGMIATGMAELAALVKERPALAGVATHDGKTLGDKAALYLAAAEDAAAVHADEWKPSGNDDGAYTFRADMASFYPQAGQNVPLNMMNAMGLLHFALARASATPAPHADKARRLVNHFLANKVTEGGGYYWNYGGGAYVAPGEDISHGSLNARFLMRAVDEGVVVTSKSRDALVRTFLDGILRDTATYADHVGGGAKENTYAPEAPMWLVTGAIELSAIARDFFGARAATKSGSELFGMALLARHDAPLSSFAFYKVDWKAQAGTHVSTAANANVLVKPFDPSKPQLARIRYQAAARTAVGQWDGKAYHTVTVLPPAASLTEAHLPFVPAWFFDYGGGNALYQLSAPAGFVVEDPVAIDAPAITSTPPATASPGEVVTYPATATGWDPKRWTIAGPGSVSAAGVVSFTAPASGEASFELAVENDVGVAKQAFLVTIVGAGGAGGAGVGGAGPGGAPSGGSGVGGAAAGGASIGGASASGGSDGTTGAGGSIASMSPVAPSSSNDADTSSGCHAARSSSSPRAAIALALLALAAASRRRPRSLSRRSP